MNASFELDRGAVRRSFDRVAAQYDAAAAVQAGVRRQLLERLDYVRLEPATILDVGCGAGHAARALKDRFPRARVIAMDLAEGMLREARRRQSLLRRFHRVCGDALALPIRDESVDLVFSSLALQWCDDLDSVFREFRRVLRPNGLLNFSTLGPGTLQELRSAWAAADAAGSHVSAFADMPHLGDGLIRAGLADPVLDVDRIVRGYPDVLALMREIKALGAHNATSGRRRGLTGRRRFAAMQASYETSRRPDGLPATWEIVFGQAWKPAGAPIRGRRSGEFGIDPAAIGRRSA